MKLTSFKTFVNSQPVTKMTKRIKTKKIKATPPSFLEQVIKELNLGKDDFSMIGNGSHLEQGNPFEKCKATRDTLVSFMVVDTATFVFLTTAKGLQEINVQGYRMATLSGPGVNGQGGVSFVLGAKGLSINYNSPDVIREFLMNLITFTSYMEGATSLNIMAYLASTPLFCEEFFKGLTYDYVKSKLWRNSNVGRTLFCEVSYIFQGIDIVNKQREVEGWGEYTKVLDKLYIDALTHEETDEDVFEYHRLASLPQFIDPSGIGAAPAELQEPLFQEIIEPDPKVVTPFDPNL